MIVLPTLTLVSDAVSYILWVHNRGAFGPRFQHPAGDDPELFQNCFGLRLSWWSFLEIPCICKL